MNSRRNFLLKGSFATTALFVAKPFKTIANAVSPITGFSVNDDKVTIVHTGNYATANQAQTLKHIKDLKNNTGNLLHFHVGHPVKCNGPEMNYDVSLELSNGSILTNNYKVIYKGNIKIGVITATANGRDTVADINTLAVYLKQVKNCNIVVCLSSLGYRNKNSVDDLGLAANSTHLDIILGGHTDNFCKEPYIALNKNQEEVIINHGAGSLPELGKIAIDFDRFGKKRNLAFNNNVQFN